MKTIKVDTNIYSKEAINSSCYKWTGTCYVKQEIQGDYIIVSFECKDGCDVIGENFNKQFENDLIDEQLRIDLNKRFGKIRDMIVEEAFKPVNK